MVYIKGGNRRDNSFTQTRKDWSSSQVTQKEEKMINTTYTYNI